MKPNELLTTIMDKEERAVSPVIGVILMVAITVILAAVIGTFVLDLGGTVGQTGPTASLTAQDHSDDWSPSDTSNEQNLLEVEHSSGDELDASSLKIVVRNVSTNAEIATWDAGTVTTGSDFSSASFYYNSETSTLTTSDTIQVGDILTVAVTQSTASAIGDSSDVSVTVVDSDTDNRIASAQVTIK